VADGLISAVSTLQPRESMSSPGLTAILVMLALAPVIAVPPQATKSVDTIAEGAVQALEEKRFGDALEAFTNAVALAPGDASLWFGKGLAAFMLGQSDVAEESLTRALKLKPRLVQASIFLGELQYQGGRVADAIATYEAALTYAPGDRALIARLDQWRKDSRFSDRLYSSRGAHFRVLFEGPADEAIARRAVEYLESAYLRVGDTLSVRPATSITVVLYTLQQFHDITRAPDWAGGLYDGTIRVAVKGALSHPDELERLLVHEFVHALVAQVGGRNVPFWLNEGLAASQEPGGTEWAASVLKRASDHPALDQLHGSFAALNPSEVPVAYAKSALAVQRLLDMRGAAAMITLLRDLRRGARFETAFHQRLAMRYDDFLAMQR
jgi:peptidase MA superfamily protein/tetratricopeptide repeat protein